MWCLFFLLGLSSALLPSGRTWYFDSVANSIVAADYFWEPVFVIPLQEPQQIISIYPVPSMKFAYYMTEDKIKRVSFSGNLTQTLVELRGERFHPQFVVDPTFNALWYQANETTHRCVSNGANCVAAKVPTSQGLALSTADNGVVYVGSVVNANPIIYLFGLSYQSGQIIATKQNMNWGCCYGVLGDVFLAHASDGALWGSVSIAANGNINYVIYRNGDIVSNDVKTPFRPPFFIAPKNPNLLFFSATATSIQQLTLGGALITVRGAQGMFIEPSECEDDCSLKGFCYSDTCSCFEEYYGPLCKTYCNDLRTCNGHGYCDHTGSCSCDPNWSGPACSHNDITPPIFPVAFTASNVMFKNSQFTHYYDYHSQKQKYSYRTGLNITSLYDRGEEYTIFPGSCSVSHLQQPTLARWQVDPVATLMGFNIPCAQVFSCSLWKTFDHEWLVTSDNIPVRINTTDGVYLYNPKLFQLGTPSSDVFDVPAVCN